VIPISIGSKPGQKNTVDTQSSGSGLAEVGRYTGIVIQDAIAPLEILTNLLFLAKKSNDPEKVREYLEEAEVHLRTVGDINLNILRFYVKYAGDTDSSHPPLLRTG
jgi:hypothetical protein